MSGKKYLPNPFSPSKENINSLCKDCVHKCTQSKIVEIIECPTYEKRCDKPINQEERIERIFIIITKDGQEIPDEVKKFIYGR